MPMIGSTTLDGLTKSNALFDLVGNPLTDLNIGLLPKLKEPQTISVHPNGIKDFTYNQTDYQFGNYNEVVKNFKNKDEEKDKNKKAKDAVKDGGEKPKGSAIKTASKFTWNIDIHMVFNLRLISRPMIENGKTVYKNYFEELDFVLGSDYKVDGKMDITLPLGINVIVTGKLDGDVIGIYQMKTNYYGDSTWQKNKVEYSAKTFGLFMKLDGTTIERNGYILLNPNISIGIAVKWAIIEVGGNANFKFDMDFVWTTSTNGTNFQSYGDMNYNFDYHVKVLTLTVYKGKLRKTPCLYLILMAQQNTLTPIFLCLCRMQCQMIWILKTKQPHVIILQMLLSGMAVISQE